MNFLSEIHAYLLSLVLIGNTLRVFPLRNVIQPVLHHLKKTFIIALNILILIGCQSKTKKELTTDRKTIPTKNRIETKVFGDSLKVVYEYRGDTIIQNRIDLKGTSDDSFDSTFIVISVWSTRTTSDLKCLEELKLIVDGIELKFCYADIFNKIDADIKKAEETGEPWKVDSLNKTKTKLLNYKHNGKEDLKEIKEYFQFSLLREIDFSAYDNQTNSMVQKVRIEKYETSFSGGRNYYFLNNANDTIARFDRTEWMR